MKLFPLVGLGFSSLRPQLLNFTKRMVSSGTTIPTVSYEDVKRLTAKDNHDDTVIIDVRRLDEIKSTGLLPGSRHIPISKIDSAFQMEKSDFQKEYGFEKPSKSQRLIFSCQLGARAYSAAVAANSMGYNAYYYPGSWAEWSAKLAK